MRVVISKLYGYKCNQERIRSIIEMAPGGAKTLADLTYRQLREDIIGGRLAAGSKLKLEGLMENYTVGMSPLREALARLAGDLLVVTEGQRGYWVAPLSIDELDDVTRVRTLIETEAVSASIRNGDAAWEEAVHQSFHALAAVEKQLPSSSELLPQSTLETWEECNRAFHSALVSASNSPVLIRLRDSLYQQSERYRRVSLNASRGWRNVHEEHHAIYTAVIERNALRACRMTEIHLRQTAEEVRKAIHTLASFDQQK
ncbi:MAG: GntR family transcriptional regulator [Brucella intermedia]